MMNDKAVSRSSANRTEISIDLPNLNSINRCLKQNPPLKLGVKIINLYMFKYHQNTVLKISLTVSSHT